MPKKSKETEQINLDNDKVEKKTLAQARNPNYGKKKCASCDQFYPEGCMIGEDEDGKPVCDRCVSDDEMEPGATVFFSDGGPMGESDTPHTIGAYHNNTDGAFKLGYVHTDGWRGYHTVSSETYEQVADDNILSMSADERELKKFDDAMRKLCDEHNIRYARVFTTSSNIFSVGFDFFVLKQDLEEYRKIQKIVDGLKVLYRDPERYKLTCLTGKDSFDAQDKLLAKAADMLNIGMDFDAVMEKTLKEAAKSN